MAVKNNKIRIQAEINSVQFQRGLNKMHRSYAHFLGNFKNTIKVASIVQDAFKKVFNVFAKGVKLAVTGIGKIVKGFSSLISKQKNYNNLQSQGQSGFAKNSKSVLAGLTGVGALAGVWFIAAKGMRAALREMNTSTDAQIKLNQVLKATGFAAGMNSNDLMESAQAMRRATRLSTSEVQNAQGVMLTFTKIGKDNFATAMDSAADMSAMFGQDMQQSVIQLGTALNDPIAGVGRLMRIGVSFSEEQRKSIKLFMDQNDVMSAQKVILQELEHEFGGVAEALADTFFGRWTQIVNAIAELASGMGQIIEKSPEVKKKMTEIRDEINKWAEVDWFMMFNTWRRDFLKGFRKFVLDIFKTQPAFVMALSSGFTLVQAAWIVTTDKLKEKWDEVTKYFDENSLEQIFEDMKTKLPSIIKDMFALIGAEIVVGISKVAFHVNEFFQDQITSAQTRTDNKIGMDDYILNLHEIMTGNFFDKDPESQERRNRARGERSFNRKMLMDDIFAKIIPPGTSIGLEDKYGSRELHTLQKMEEVLQRQGVDFTPEFLGKGRGEVKTITGEQLQNISELWATMLNLAESTGTLDKLRASEPLTRKVLAGGTGMNQLDALFARIEAEQHAGFDAGGIRAKYRKIFGYTGSQTSLGGGLSIGQPGGRDPILGPVQDFVKEVTDMAEELGPMFDEETIKAYFDPIIKSVTDLLDAVEENTGAQTGTGGTVAKISSLNETLTRVETELKNMSTQLGAGLAEGGSVRGQVGSIFQKFFTDHYTQAIESSFAPGHSLGGMGGGFLQAILPGLGGGLLGGLIGGLFNKKPKPVKKPVPVKVVNWGDMTAQLLKASSRRAVSPMITSGGNIGMSRTFNRDMRV